MKGIELSKLYFETYGVNMLQEFPEIQQFLCAGLIGSGSECLGFDDDVSCDHDFEPGFGIYIPGEDIVDRKTAFRMERAYATLPSEFEGYNRNRLSPVGGSRVGIIRIPELLEEKTGTPDGNLSLEEWLTISDQFLLEITNGCLFMDNYKQMTEIREKLAFYPEDVRKKRLAGHLLLMAQSGQYNYQRCLKHGEQAAAQLSVFEFVNHGMSAVFLLNRCYKPYYKWSFRTMRELNKLSVLAETFEYLITTSNDSEFIETKYDLIEDAAASIIDELQNQGITKAICGDLEKHAYSVNDCIENSTVRNLNVLTCV